MTQRRAYTYSSWWAFAWATLRSVWRALRRIIWRTFWQATFSPKSTTWSHKDPIEQPLIQPRHNLEAPFLRLSGHLTLSSILQQEHRPIGDLSKLHPDRLYQARSRDQLGWLGIRGSLVWLHAQRHLWSNSSRRSWRSLHASRRSIRIIRGALAQAADRMFLGLFTDLKFVIIKPFSRSCLR